MGLRTGARAGLIAAVVTIFLILIGVHMLMGRLAQSWLRVPAAWPGVWLTIVLLGLWAGSRAVSQMKTRSWSTALAAGASAGVIQGALVGTALYILSSVTQAGVDLRAWFNQMSKESIGALTVGLAPLPAAGFIAGILLVSALAGAAWREWRLRVRTARLARGERIVSLRERLLEAPAISQISSNPLSRRVLMGVFMALLLIAPFFLGQYWNYNLGTVGIYVILGLGLNIVVGMAGLLDLGYVAFFAVGAYTMALLTAPQPHHIQMSFWLALPIGVALAAVAGILLGIPVLRMRGDYLAIVTLGFGEIIRILSKSDVLTGFTGGPRGVRAVGHPVIFGQDIGNEFYFFYFILIGVILSIIITRRLEHSRVGRAWRAMREDERVAQAMGIYTLKYKLMAFAMGAALAGFGGAIFASRNTFTGPEDFVLLVSINVLALVIVGGMGSIPGVILGAFVLKGLPEMLRELEDYRVLVFGALLVVMMIVRPQGLWPASRPQLERPKPEAEAVEAPAELLEGEVGS